MVRTVEGSTGKLIGSVKKGRIVGVTEIGYIQRLEAIVTKFRTVGAVARSVAITNYSRYVRLFLEIGIESVLMAYHENEMCRIARIQHHLYSQTLAEASRIDNRPEPTTGAMTME